LDLVASELLERETLDGRSFRRLLQQEGPPAGEETDPAAGALAGNSKSEAGTRNAKKEVVNGDMIETK
jgi:hypothetical protein